MFVCLEALSAWSLYHIVTRERKEPRPLAEAG